MQRSSFVPRAWKFVAMAVASSVSAGALFVLVQVERGKVHAALAPEPVIEPTDYAPPASLHAIADDRAQPPSVAAGARVKAEPSRGAPSAAAPAEEPSTNTVRVPDFTGKRYGQARREAKKLGLKLVARDEYGERVPAELGPYYRVRKQSVEPETALPPGSKVEVRVRATESFASGY